MKTGKLKYVGRLMAIILVLIFACWLFSACYDGAVGEDGMEESQQLFGGDASLGKGVNLRDIGIETQGNNTVINMSFIKGSRMAGVNEAMISKVPVYAVSILPAPARLKVDLDIDFADYSSESELLADSVVYGTFKVERKDGKFSIYFQLNDNVMATVEPKDSMLSIKLVPENSVGKTAYYAGLDAFAEYQQNKIPDELGLTPTMGIELTDIILISQAYASAEQAQQKADAINDALKNTNIATKAYVFEMDTDSRPVIERQPPEQSVKEKPVIAGVDDEAYPLPVLIENGEYLCTAPNGKVIFYRQIIPKTDQETEQVLKYELWEIDKDRNEKKLSMPELYGVEQAAVSASGTYLAILESGASNKILHVLNLQTKALQNLGEEGFGDVTSGFVWDDSSDMIYAMTGSGNLQLTKYDFALPEGERISSVEEKNGAESKLALLKGKLYFADQQAKPNGEIYCVDINDAQRTTVARGIEFALSADGRHIATRINVVQGEGAGSSSLNIKNLYTEQEINVVKDVSVEDFAFGADAGTLYYTTQTYEGTRGEYPYAFIKYSLATGKSEFLGYSKTGNFVPSANKGEIYIIDYFEQNDYNYPVTYIYTEDS